MLSCFIFKVCLFQIAKASLFKRKGPAQDIRRPGLYFCSGMTSHNNLNKSLSGPNFSFVKMRNLASLEGKHLASNTSRCVSCGKQSFKRSVFEFLQIERHYHSSLQASSLIALFVYTCVSVSFSQPQNVMVQKYNYLLGSIFQSQ